MTNGFISIVNTSPNHINQLKSELDHICASVFIRGNSLSVSANSFNSFIGTPIKIFKDKLDSLDKIIDLASKSNMSIVSVYSKENNLYTLDNKYNCAIDGAISNKDKIISNYGLNADISDAECIARLYSIFRQSLNDVASILRKLFESLQGSFSVIIQDLLLQRQYVFTNKPLFFHYIPSLYMIVSSDCPRNYELQYCTCGVNKAYCFNMNSCYLENSIALDVNMYRNKFTINRASMFFDGSIESATALFVLNKVIKCNYLEIAIPKRNNSVIENFLAQSCSSLFMKLEYTDSLLSYINSSLEQDIDTVVDYINVNSIDRDFSERYTYKKLFELYTHGKIKYIPVFNYLNLIDIVRIGSYLNVPYEKLISCENPILSTSLTQEFTNEEAKYSQRYDPEIYVHCGGCKVCKRDFKAFYSAGIADPYSSKYLNEIKIDEPFTPREITSKEFNNDYLAKILSTIEI